MEEGRIVHEQNEDRFEVETFRYEITAMLVYNILEVVMASVTDVLHIRFLILEVPS